jgi:hypothetical protein
VVPPFFCDIKIERNRTQGQVEASAEIRLWRIRTCAEPVERILPPLSGIILLFLRIIRCATGVPIILGEYRFRAVLPFLFVFLT